MNLDCTYSEDGVSLKLPRAKGAMLARLMSGRKKDLRKLSSADADLLYAIGDLKAFAEDAPEALTILSDEIRMSHRLAARLDGKAARIIGLPPVVDLIFRTDAEGVLGSRSFKLRYQWVKNGQLQYPRRIGCILDTASGPRRLPEWLLEAVEIAEQLTAEAGDAEQWEALARFRRALEPGADMSARDAAARISMTDFLSGLEVRLTDGFSLSPNEDGTDFEVVPFSAERLSSQGLVPDNGDVSERHGELDPARLKIFQRRVRDRGAMSAYRINPGSYLVVDRAALPALEAIASMQHAPTDERAAFIRNPRPKIDEAIERALRRRGELDGMDPIGVEDAVERAAGPVLIETKEFSERVIGLKVFKGQDAVLSSENFTTWLPEDYARRFADYLQNSTSEQLEELRERVSAAMEAGEESVQADDLEIPARAEAVSAIDARLSQPESAPDEPEGFNEAAGPVVLETITNESELRWIAKLKPRKRAVSEDHPAGIRTPLKPHQLESLDWQIAAWSAGLPGVLNADEQGLGKTLQTISFLAWLKAHMESSSEDRGPVLIVAPTSLLLNWEQEVTRHLEEPGLGHLIRLYGSGIGARKLSGFQGRDIDGGEAKIDFGFLHEAIQERRAHRFWMLTTYTTLVNYQHSLGKIRFATAVFDEIQALKNPFSMRALAARGVNADFRIGLTGTPIENGTADLWAVMDQIASGCLDALEGFRQRYGVPTADGMSELHQKVFKSHGGLPPLALRRLKSDVESGLPEKARMIHPRLMPKYQSLVYDDAKLKLAQGGAGAALKMLHHIRAVSVHPSLDEGLSDADFIPASARLQAVFEILKAIERKAERALVFIEHRRMQYRFIELIKAQFGLDGIDLINGDTPIKKRQEIVDRFQAQQGRAGFDLLVLGPKAAGTGLTLTAATHVIHLSRWWNPAVEEQCNDRVHRIGQTKPVTVHVPMAVHAAYREHSFDCLLHSLMQRKRNMAESALWPMGDTEADAAELQRMVAEGNASSAASADPVKGAMAAMFARDGAPLPPWQADGSLKL
ncbi:DEAD/DEAH box helicase [Bradyrhizobium sp. U87765 SZCCT0131]|uniref:DEAD/DEAH box helicase n=1 Tax=unclassified Bradyrhizobium TaxID=2631580 RepID=UPI001BAABFB7|nr:MULTISPECIES: DEAD/DEAH box helicase [unclassified Bradyrhizobium]MBR1216412.1 DEAD/DEAH box helicase [Bradyrhizobium sp. U87765 SZCCT0131]MBR1259840.1 DEAD/DEAH box helicase [Bradyrhizobium sp. U87765 SZCCT0134]MBR1305973.1 DEAD/DEAH box helicase [Bradyrhizobium sp. U87765 SZCCT0110]MBR1322340.1 DEAD/DEAH box helicase [Bradyrhizobium sp. U87765 SZCCT0109]MBR1352369.1 DEAD/DEAH box helicase [Bradyrhizobium sp. U87765 SZCCT0048]